MRHIISAGIGRQSSTLGAPLFTLTLILAGIHSANAAVPPRSLPVYEVTHSGVRDAQARKLAEGLRLRPEKLVLRDGVASYIDPENYLSVPKVDVTDPDALQKLRNGLASDPVGSQVRRQAVDFAALEKSPVLESAAALRRAAEAFSVAGLMTLPAKPSVGHAKFVASMADGSRSVSHELNTWVSYEFSTKNGYPLIGPGAQARVTYDGAGSVVQFVYALRDLKPGPEVRILSEEDARKHVAKSYPEKVRLTFELVYWSPSLHRASGGKKAIEPAFIIPWYAVHALVPVTDPNTGVVSEMRSKVQLIPATDDPRFVPTAHLRVSGRERVQATVDVHGGRLPYTYVWSASDPHASGETGTSINYVPIVRALPRRGENLPENLTLPHLETVAVTVIDANGVTFQASETLSVISHLVAAGKGGSSASYGTESPREPTFAVDRVGWQNGMGAPGAGGGTEVFAWLGDLAWPGDFIEPNPPGSLPATPWINGDADYANWGVNTAAIVLNNTDGWATGFDSSEPGATLAEYATAYLASPSSTGVTVVTGLLNGTTTPSTINSSINYNGSWTPVGPNDQLLWLVMDACDTLDATSSAGTPSQRWGAAFGGLHLLLGFNSEEQVGDGSFEQDFAENMLGVSGTPQQIVVAWFNAGATAGMGHGVPAVLGALGPGGVCDQFDYYLGKGTQGPTILPSAVTGWWYISD
jgi:hypothetical protein